MKKIAAIGAALALPSLAFAQTVNSVQDLGDFVITMINTVIVPVIFALAFLVFVWGAFQFFVAGGADEEKRDKGKQMMLWGLIGFFVMISVWGLVNILVGTVSLDDSIPTFPEADTI